ncbi:hypothetical protein BT69DRAFT_1221801 [Atractiella rhizophila]|nr:hypothetical protein BT69DRAFT_1221801 [Atractiella rhizophila]
MVNPRVFLDFQCEGELFGRVVFELFVNEVPKTCENFRALCTGEKGVSPKSNVPLHYKGCSLHKVIPGFMVQVPDFTRQNGTGGESIYGSQFADENLSRKLDAEGLLCMANKGPNTNASQFFITLRPCPHLDGINVVFGKVISGYDAILKISNVDVSASSVPLKKVYISHCGELERRQKKPPPPSSSCTVSPFPSKS